MKNLIEIAKIVTKKKVRKIEIFDDYSLKNKSSKFNEFYEALTAGRFKNDRDAATFLYGSTPTDDKYRQLKSRFRKRLLNTLFFLDVNLPSASNYDRAYYSCNKDWTVVKILISNEAHATASSLARHILTTALKFKFADVIVNCSRILRRYAAETGEEKSFELYDQHIKQYQNILSAEIRSEELYQRVIMNYYKPHSKITDLPERIDTYCVALDGLSQIYESPIIVYNKYLVWSFRYEMLRDFEQMLNICKQAEQYIEDNPTYYQGDKLLTFHLKRISAYLHLGDASLGMDEALNAIEAFPKGSNDWFSYNEYCLLYAMHTDNYEIAQRVYNEVLSYNKYKRSDSDIRERWKILGYYVHYVEMYLDNTSTNTETLNRQRKSFKLDKFLAEKPLYPKKERMYSVHTWVIQMLFYIESGSFSQVREVIEQLKMYANRQLRKEEYFRAIQFIRLLHQLLKAEFQVDDLSNVEKYYERLVKEQPFFYRGLITELEVIPFEKLWKIILDRVDRRIRSRFVN